MRIARAGLRIAIIAVSAMLKHTDTNDSTLLRVSDVSADDDTGLADVVELHMDLLDFGPMAGLGTRFIREAGYRLHMVDGLLQVALCRVDSRPAGFIAYTARSISFHRQSLGAHWLKVSWILLLSLLEDPRRFVKLVRALKVIASRRRENERGSDPLGEIVAIAVRREYLRGALRDPEGKRLSASLVAYAQRELGQLGVDRMRMLVDADNKGALFLYHGLGARMEAYEQAGEPMVEVWFDLHPDETGK